MSKTTNIKIGRKTYKLKFGYGVNRKLSQVYDLASYSALGQFIDGLNFGGEDLTFDQTDFIGHLIFCAISYSQGEDPIITKDEIIDGVLLSPEQLAAVLEGYMASFPKGDDAKGKQQPTRKRK